MPANTISKRHNGVFIKHSKNFWGFLADIAFDIYELLEEDENVYAIRCKKITNQDELRAFTESWMMRRGAGKILVPFSEGVFIYTMYYITYEHFKTELAERAYSVRDAVKKQMSFEKYCEWVIDMCGSAQKTFAGALEDYPEFHYRKNYLDKLFPK